MRRDTAVFIFLLFIVVGQSIPSLYASSVNVRRGYATYYTKKSAISEGTSGTHTANGERFNEGAQTCALRRRDFGKIYKVTNVETGTWVYVRHNDFGPGKKATKRGVIIDLSPKAFRLIADKNVHRIEVEIREVVQ